MSVNDENENEDFEPDPSEDEVTSPVEEAGVESSLSVQDLVVIQNVINVASQRAAFRTEELEGVGRIYNKLTAFLNSLDNKDTTE